MTRLFDFSFSLTPPATPKPTLVTHAYNEFVLELPEHWRQVPTAEERTFTYESTVDAASLIISADFYDIPPDKAQQFADNTLAVRLDAHRQQANGPIEVISQGIKPHSRGEGLELHYAAAGVGRHVMMYLGYVTSRKVLNFSLVCGPDSAKAIALFNRMAPHFRAKLP